MKSMPPHLTVCLPKGSGDRAIEFLPQEIRGTASGRSRVMTWLRSFAGRQGNRRGHGLGRLLALSHRQWGFRLNFRGGLLAAKGQPWSVLCFLKIKT
jgi:hypothetical protein